MTLLDDIDAETATGPPQRQPRLRAWFYAAVALLCGLLILAHFGCHRDEDTELFGVTTISK
ncbi:MAG: hypothetical protein L0Y71_04550 [Gemmataceae bacterium]|nr:hypothetical protein [Gemmataceae bacterium]